VDGEKFSTLGLKFKESFVREFLDKKQGLMRLEKVK